MEYSKGKIVEGIIIHVAGEYQLVKFPISRPTKEEDTSTGGASNFSTLDYAGTIDFTYDKATQWYQHQLLEPLLKMGVKCIKTDFGENIHMDQIGRAHV